MKTKKEEVKTLRDRVMGVENEYAFMEQDREGKIEAAESLYLALPMYTPLPKHMSMLCEGSIWTSNGSRIYVDQGHPEFASCECRYALDVVRYERAGELLTQMAFGNKAQQNGKRVVLFRNNLYEDPQTKALATYGCHESYLTFTKKVDHNIDLQQMLIPFLISRQILDGAGWWGGDGTFVLSQRALVMEAEIGASTTMSRAIFCTREKHLMTSDFQPRARLHLIVGDANISEVATFLKFGTTALVLSLFEEGFQPPIECAKAVQAIKDISYGDGRERVVSCKDGSRMSALEIQSRYLEAVQRYLRKTSFESERSEAEAKRTVTLWEHALNAIHAQDKEWMIGRLDYATKRFIAEQEVHRSNPQNPQHAIDIKRDIDLLYHSVSDRRFRKRLNTHWAHCRLVTDREIRRAAYKPPRDTRAYLRGRFVSTIKRADRKKPLANIHIRVHWTSLTFGTTNYRLDDPLINDLDGFNRTLKSITS